MRVGVGVPLCYVCAALLSSATQFWRRRILRIAKDYVGHPNLTFAVQDDEVASGFLNVCQLLMLPNLILLCIIQFYTAVTMALGHLDMSLALLVSE